MNWLRLYTDIRSDAKLAMLAFEDQRHYIWLLTLQRDSVLDDFQGEMLDKVVAKQLGLDLPACLEVKKRLRNVSLVTEGWKVLGWEARQHVSDSSTERVRKHREKVRKQRGTLNKPVEHPKRSSNVSSNEGVTSRTEQNRTELNRGRFTPPTEGEVRDYCGERGNTVDPSAFIAHYEANGWKVGRNPMKDWKAAVRTWEARRENDRPRVDKFAGAI